MRTLYSVGFRMSEFKQKKKGYCAYCGKKLIGKQRKWCSRKCQDEVYEKFVAPTIKDWNAIRKRVLKRDNWTCSQCGHISKENYEMEVHHVKKVKDYPELEFEASNCITLCYKCHKKRHSKRYNLRGQKTLLELKAGVEGKHK